jgi:membrane fusion protein, heavy metal efflux system
MHHAFSFMILLAFTLITGCHHHHDHDEHEHHDAVRLTAWTDSLEVFVEYDQPIGAGVVSFTIHLTRMSTWSPVTEGDVTLLFTSSNGNTRQAVSTNTVRPGIYVIQQDFPTEETYDMTLMYRGVSLRDSCALGAVIISSRDEGAAALPHDGAASLTGFTKEEQWSIDFMTESVDYAEIQSSVSAGAEILAVPGRMADISAPVNGIVNAVRGSAMPAVGSRVARGSVLALLSPDPADTRGLAHLRAEYLDAKTDYERVQRLYAEGAVSDKRLVEARHRHDAAKAGYDVLRASASWESDESGALVRIKSPITGHLERVTIVPGRHVTAGQSLFVVVDASRLLLRASLPAAHIAALHDITDAWFRIEGFGHPFRISALNGSLISRGRVIDAATRTLPVIFEFDNPENALTIGLFVEAHLQLRTGDAALAIPRHALIDEGDGVYSVFVQHGGEEFERRVVTPGQRDEHRVTIRQGLKHGERIVTRGAQYVRLASLSTAIPDHGHTH